MSRYDCYTCGGHASIDLMPGDRPCICFWRPMRKVEYAFAVLADEWSMLDTRGWEQVQQRFFREELSVEELELGA